MIQSRQKVKALCDRLMNINPMQIIINLVQDDIETLVCNDESTPDEVLAMSYRCDLLLDIYSDQFPDDIRYLADLIAALNNWGTDLERINKTLGIDPNK